MKKTYTVQGMTCSRCVASVTEKLMLVKGVTEVQVNLEKSEAQIEMEKNIPIDELKQALADKYLISEKVDSVPPTIMYEAQDKSKFQQLKPLFLIFLFLFSAAFLMNYQNWNTANAMLDFMGLFYIVFSFFKLLDLKGFPESFRMYDPLAKVLPVYAWIYPFIELVLGLLFLMRIQITFALIATILVLGITTIGVTKTLLNKKQIRCACLGTALKLPMTEATFIENSIMLIMAFVMLFKAIL